MEVTSADGAAQFYGGCDALGLIFFVHQVIQRANANPYGLAAGVCTKNIDTANQISRGLRAGTVWVNCFNNFDDVAPFGGYKISGIGRDKGEYALENYTEVGYLS